MFNLARVVQAVRQADLMLSHNLQAPLVANSVSGLAWAIGFGVAAIGLYRLQRRARRWTLAAIVLYLVNLWLIRLAFSRSSDEVFTRPADAALSMLSILVVWAFLFWPGVRRAFS